MVLKNRFSWVVKETEQRRRQESKAWQACELGKLGQMQERVDRAENFRQDRVDTCVLR